jgi:two-component system OmpR family sensor kinase/two-component system sensor histidine kinase BaeS
MPHPCRQANPDPQDPNSQQHWHGGWQGGWDSGSWREWRRPPGWAGKRRFLFWRFVGFLGAFSLLFLLALTILLAVALGQQRGFPLGPGVLLLVFCGVPFAFFGLVALLGSLIFRRIGSPMAEVMAAADAVAEGDLTVRVREGVPGEVGRLASSFNRMTAELARAEQQRRNLTADVAHELRTPLHIIQGNLEGLLDGVYESTPEHIAATLEETHLLARLVNDLQTLSLAETGQLPLHPVDVSAADLLSDVATSFAGQAAEAGIELKVESEGEPARLELHADPDRLDQVLSNLVANGLRYTPSGGQITMRAEPLPDGVRLTVSDQGEGIPPEELPYIFDRFWRGDRSRTRSSSTGSGLGLAIAKGLVQAHGGRIRADSRPGQGTTFTIDLPRISS